MKFHSVYLYQDAAAWLYALLLERDDSININHKSATILDHIKFFNSLPYRSWDIIEVEGVVVGAIYLTRSNEIGIFIFKEHQGKGYGPSAIKMMVARHPGERLLANINPANDRSIAMFAGIGFELSQQTYAIQA